MATEIEIKYKIVRDKIPELTKILANYKSLGRNYEWNSMYDNDQKTMDSVDARLRVRLISESIDSENKHIQFTYKRRISVVNGIKEEEEIEVEFDTESKSFILILEKMGYSRTSTYERFRETFIYNDIKITYDEFPYGVVLEIEGDKDALLDLETELNLTQKDRYALSCDDLYNELCEANGIKPKNDILFNDANMPKY